MKKLLTGLLLAAVIFGSLSVTAYAHGPQGRFAGNADRYNRRAENFGIGYRQIEMTDSQLEKIDEFRTEFFEETEELRDNMRELNWEIRDLYMTDAEAEEIEAVEAELETVWEELDQKRLENQGKIESILTEEQLEQINENRMNYQGRFNNDMQGRYNQDFRSGKFNSRTGNRSYGPGYCH